jgi:uncharacterized repeat protein (TIGR01451 family)
VLGAVDYVPWSASPISLTVAPVQPLVLAARDVPDTGALFIQNRDIMSDTVRVTLTDARGWLTPPTTFDVTLAGPSARAPVSFTIPAGTALGVEDVVTATVVSLGDPALSDSDSFRIQAALVADLAVRQQVSEDPAGVGVPLSYTLRMANRGPDDAPNALLTDTLPAGVTFLSAQPEQGVCNEAAGVVRCELGELPAHDAVVVTLRVLPTAPGVLLNLVDATSDAYDPTPATLLADYTRVNLRLYLPMFCER